jgi:uncharacterized membrane protein
LFVHTSFALHYAHEYYGEGVDRRRGGLNFPAEGGESDYWDLLRGEHRRGRADLRIRRGVLAHTTLAFLFNATILALAVNVGASAI